MENIDNMAKNSLNALSQEALTEEEQKKIKWTVIKGSFTISCLIVGLIYNVLFPNKTVVPALFYTIGFLVEGIPIFIVAIKGIFSKELKNAMEMLVVIAIIACYCSGQLILAILIPLILNVAHFLEERSIVGGREVIEGLRRMNHSKALLYEDGEEREVEAEVLKKGNLF
jgi:Cd2+/Zn2+-exporting ATPase/Cu+-exporting ATPase